VAATSIHDTSTLVTAYPDGWVAATSVNGGWPVEFAGLQQGSESHASPWLAFVWHPGFRTSCSTNVHCAGQVTRSCLAYVVPSGTIDVSIVLRRTCGVACVALAPDPGGLLSVDLRALGRCKCPAISSIDAPPTCAIGRPQRFLFVRLQQQGH
jgi:hypothetical protein